MRRVLPQLITKQPLQPAQQPAPVVRVAATPVAPVTAQQTRPIMSFCGWSKGEVYKDHFESG